VILVLLLFAVVGLVLIASTRSAAAASARTNQFTSAPVGAGHRSHDHLSGFLAAGALLWVVGAVLALFFAPMIVRESASSSSGSSVVTVTRDTSPLIQVSGPARAAAVAVAAVAVIVGLRVGRPPRLALFVMAYLAIAFCVVTGFSIGLFFLPVPALLLAAGVTSPTHSPQGPASSARER
jgi:hypothetical protein